MANRFKLIAEEAMRVPQVAHSGRSSRMWVHDGFRIKASKDPSGNKTISHEYDVGKDLQEHSVDTPNMHYLGECDDFRYLVMDDLPTMVPLETLSGDDRRDAAISYRNVLDTVEALGYEPRDFNPGTNCGWLPEKRKVVCFDFARWIKR